MINFEIIFTDGLTLEEFLLLPEVEFSNEAELMNVLKEFNNWLQLYKITIENEKFKKIYELKYK